MTWGVHNVDCLAFMRSLPAGSVDAIVTSPPYAMQRAKQYGGVSEADYPDWTAKWMDAVRPALSESASVLINIREHVRDGEMSDYVHKTRMCLRHEGWIECDEVVWLKPNAPPLGDPSRPRRSWERVLWFSPVRHPYVDPRGSGRPSNRIGLMGSNPHGVINGCSKKAKIGIARHTDAVTVSVATNSSGHPAMYPVGLAEYLIRGWSMDGATILDPFTGSGTTGVACIQTGRNFIGCEIDPGYTEIAMKRCREAEESACAVAGASK